MEKLLFQICNPMNFVDFASIQVKAGNGGNGCIAFLRENKYIMSLYPKWVREKIDKYIYKPGSNLVPMTKREFKEIKKFGKESATKSIISTLKDLE